MTLQAAVTSALFPTGCKPACALEATHTGRTGPERHRDSGSGPGSPTQKQNRNLLSSPVIPQIKGREQEEPPGSGLVWVRDAPIRSRLSLHSDLSKRKCRNYKIIPIIASQIITEDEHEQVLASDWCVSTLSACPSDTSAFTHYGMDRPHTVPYSSFFSTCIKIKTCFYSHALYKNDMNSLFSRFFDLLLLVSNIYFTEMNDLHRE